MVGGEDKRGVRAEGLKERVIGSLSCAMAPIRPPQLVPHDDILPCILVMVMITMMGMVVVVVVMTMMLSLPPPPHTHPSGEQL